MSHTKCKSEITVLFIVYFTHLAASAAIFKT